MSMVGPLAQAMLDNIYFDQLFLGASAIADDGWITSHDAEEARVNQRMVERAKQTFVLCDAGKLGERATYSVLRLGEPLHLITSDTPSSELLGHIRDSTTTLTVANGDVGNA